VTVSESVSVVITRLIVSVFDLLDVTELWFELIPALKPFIYDSVTVSENIRSVYTLPLIYDSVTVSTVVSLFIPTLTPSRYDLVTVSEYVRVVVVDCSVIAYDLVTVSESLTIKITSLKVSVDDSITIDEEFSPKITVLRPFVYDSVYVSEDFESAYSTAFHWYEMIDVSEFFAAEIVTHTRSTLNTPFGVYVPDTRSGSAPKMVLWGDADN